MKVQRALPVELQRLFRHISGHIRVAIAIGANPRAELQNFCHTELRFRISVVQFAIKIPANIRNHFPERIHKSQAPLDLIEYIRTTLMQEIGLPQSSNFCSDSPVVFLLLAGQQVHIVCTREILPNAMQFTAHCRALCFRGMGGENRFNSHIRKQVGKRR
ncbi:MAG: hypothetical protein MAGBODY4_01662 [Candidatus Marinimicrobia bacterium]|nr:hypothetical protein [Candidatus Neomarinimicrobiota bacterium]